MSDGRKSSGCTPRNAATLQAYRASIEADASAIASLVRTDPDRYASAVSHVS